MAEPEDVAAAAEQQQQQAESHEPVAQTTTTTTTIQSSEETHPPSEGMEMNKLTTSTGASQEKSNATEAVPESVPESSESAALPPNHAQPSAATEAEPSSSSSLPPAAATTAPTQAPAQTTDPQISRNSPEPLGPANFKPISAPAPATEPTLNLVIMLTTGARHPYRIDERYLRSRKVTTETMSRSGNNVDDDDHNHGGTGNAFEPRELSGYQLKELIWTDWREEWQSRPASPSSIRLIILGRMIEDKSMLRDFPFTLDKTNVVHMTVKPADLIDDDDTGHKGSSKMGPLRVRDGDDRGAGCRCVIL